MSVKILIVSDSHGNNRNLIQAVKNMRGTMDMMIHLGDMECSPDSIRSLVECPVEMVKGNCDYGNELQGARLIEIGEHKAFITHGNRYGGELGIPTMKDIAKENGADIVMFGHSHKPVIDTKSYSCTKSGQYFKTKTGWVQTYLSGYEYRRRRKNRLCACDIVKFYMHYGKKK